MRLQELYIEEYKVLKDFTLRFDEQSAVSVLIGENGSGKTTVVECLTLIFAELYKQSLVSDLYEKATFPFNFVLRYRLFRASPFDSSFSQFFGDGYFDVTISNRETLFSSVQSDGGDVYDSPARISEFLQHEGQSLRPVRYLFPANVVVYYSGISTIIERVAGNYQQQQILGSLDGELKANPDLFYFKPENFPALLIGLLSYRYGDIPDLLESDFQINKIDAFDRIVIKIRRPTWAKSRSMSANFWGATGDLANFLAVLRDRTNTELGDDHITFTILTPTQLSEVWGFYGQEKSLFEYLITLQANGLVEAIDVDLRKDGDLIVPYQRLSEGEKQRLIIIALREMLAASENSLFLLDEPDTYLHPKWKRTFIANFQSEDRETDKFLAYYLITTHSPGIVSGMKKEQLHILQKAEGRSQTRTFAFNPYGKPEDQILLDFFGLTGLRYKPVEEDLTKLRFLIAQGNYESEEYRDLFEQLEKKIGKDDEGIIRLRLEIARRKRAAQAE